MRLLVWLHRGIGGFLVLGAVGSTTRPVLAWTIALAWIFTPRLVRAMLRRPLPAASLTTTHQRRWIRNLKKSWPELAHAAGLAHDVPARLSNRRLEPGAVIHTVPALFRVSGHEWGARLVVRACIGQTTDDVQAAAQRLRDTLGVEGVSARELGPGVVCFDLFRSDPLAIVREATFPETIDPHMVHVGRNQSGEEWMLPVGGLHTLVVGCSGAGKGSVFWSVACGLAPGVYAGLVRLFAIDLKMGMEVSIGRPLFSAVATDEQQAIGLLRGLDSDMRARGRRMQGHSRRHVACQAEPLVVLMIDELVALTSYVSDAKLRKEACELLSRLLTQGRAVGFVVVGCLQDPRKEVLPMRNLFTQTVALRLRSRDEVAMVLGAGIADEAPADNIRPNEQGMAYAVAEDGSVTRVRADFWPDALIRQVATHYPAPYTVTTKRVDANTRRPTEPARRAPRKSRTHRAA